MLPTPFEVQHLVRVEDPPNSPTKPKPTWANPVTRRVYGWAPAGTGEPFELAREPVTWDIDLYAPADFKPGPHDRIALPGEALPFDIEGQVQDFSYGPFGFQPGVRIRLRRVDG